MYFFFLIGRRAKMLHVHLADERRLQFHFDNDFITTGGVHRSQDGGVADRDSAAQNPQINCEDFRGRRNAISSCHSLEHGLCQNDH